MAERSVADFTRKALVAVGLLVLVAAAYLLSYLFVLIFAAVVLAVILRTMAERLARFGLSDGLAVTAAVLLLFAAFALFFWIFGGLVTGQFQELWRKLPQAVAGVQAQAEQWGVRYDFSKLSRQFEGQVSGLLNRASGFVFAIGGVLADVVVVIAGGIFFAAQPGYYREGMLRLVPGGVEGKTGEVLDDCGRGLRQWLKAQLLSSLFVAVLTFTGFAILGLPSSIALAIIAGAMDFIPFVGPIIAAIPAIAIGFSQSPVTALWVVALFLVVQQIQGNVLQPMVQKQSVDLPPVVLLFAVTAAGILLGPPGVLLSAPLTVAGYILVQHFYIAGVLGKEPKRPRRKGATPT